MPTPARRTLARALCLSAVACLVPLAFWAGRGRAAATASVTSTSDTPAEGLSTPREAITSANAGATPGAAGGGAAMSGAAAADSAASAAATLAVTGDTMQNVTQTGSYRITVRGADGGNSAPLNKGGGGATVAATFAFQAGDALTLVTGVAGDYGSSNGGAGGRRGSGLVAGGLHATVRSAATSGVSVTHGVRF